MKVLILGDGLLGTELSNQTGWDYISRKKDKFDITDISTYHLLTKVEFGAIQHCPYDVIINTIAYTDTYSDNKKEHWEVNYKGVSNLVEFCNKWKIKLVHIVTDYIYSNSIPNASETDVPVHCNNWYGYTKLLGDAYVQLKSNNYLLLRGTHKEKPFKYKKAWANQKGNFTYVDENVKIISKLIELNKNGIYNIGTSLKSIYDLALETNSNILPIDRPSNVPGDLSMNINKLNKFLNEYK
tara:strand:+ start:107 stop:826 length:720 start_codon:yes stop_codon:yes gene_type:complete